MFLENTGAELLLFSIACAVAGKCDIKPRITGINTQDYHVVIFP
jgi:hypothetical protein